MSRSGSEDLGKTLERLDALLAETKDPERLRMGMGIRLALGMAQELRQGAALGSRTSGMVAAWTDEHGREAVDRAVQIAREFLTKPDALRKAMGQRLGLDGDAADGRSDIGLSGDESSGDGALGDEVAEGGPAGEPGRPG